MNAVSNDLSFPDRLLDLLGGHRVTAALCTAVELGVVESLAAGERTAADVANECSTHAQSTERLLITLVALGICQSVGQSRYLLTDMGACLAKNAKHSLRSWAVFEGKMLSRSWLGLTDSVRSGRTAAELAEAEGGRYGQMHRDSEAALVFDAAMANMTRLVAPDLIAAGDLNNAGKILDVGGGDGTLLIEILRACPTTSGSVLDLERCEAAARRAIAAAGMQSRANFLVADFFAGLPAGFDTIVLKNVLHNWNDERCAVLLANCRSALADAGRIVVAERFLSPRDSRSRFASTALGDLNMLLGPGGRERSEEDYCKLLTSAGLRVARLIPAGRYDLLIAAR